MTAFELGRLLWEARKREAWGPLAEQMMARTPYPDRPGDTKNPQAAEHELAIAQAKAILKDYTLEPKQGD